MKGSSTHMRAVQSDARTRLIEDAFLAASKSLRGLSSGERLRVVAMLLIMYQQEGLAPALLQEAMKYD